MSRRHSPQIGKDRGGGRDPMDAARYLILLTLDTGVPLEIHRLQQLGGPRWMDWEWAQKFGGVLSEKGDVLQFRPGPKQKPGRPGELMGGLIRAIAIMSFVPGGITFLGRHWETPQPKC